MKNRKKPLIIVLCIVLILALAFAGVWVFWLKDYLAVRGASPVYVNSVSTIIGLDTGASSRYSGLVEPQQTYQIKKDESKTVSEVLVEVGDEVQPGDLLFRYDTKEMQFNLEQAEIDQQSTANLISTLQRQKTEAEANKKKAPNDEQQAYEVQINELDIQIKQQQAASSKKKVEIDNLRESLQNAEVYSEVSGVVKEIADENNMSGTSNAFITVLASGGYRVRGSVSELNYASLSVGQAVVVHSRTSDETVWSGEIESIDQEAASDNNNNYYYYGDSGEKSSTYYFYVTLTDPTGLILGQHVYIEPNLGEDTRKDGLWLPSMYLAHDETGSFVWSKGENEKLQKQLVTLGEYDADSDSYEITSGLARTDFIAYPAENLLPGMPTTQDPTAVTDWGDDSETDWGLDDDFAVGDDDYNYDDNYNSVDDGYDYDDYTYDNSYDYEEDEADNGEWETNGDDVIYGEAEIYSPDSSEEEGTLG